jgi:alpha-N-arabinofuranosidase
MANIAQTVNVLQSVLLTEGAKTIKTPTFFIFKMYKGHQEGILVDTEVEDNYAEYTDNSVPAISVSASEKDKLLTITLANADISNDYELKIDTSRNIKEVKGSILTGEISAKNTFEDANKIYDKAFEKLSLENQTITLTIPKGSIISLEISEY